MARPTPRQLVLMAVLALVFFVAITVGVAAVVFAITVAIGAWTDRA